MLGLYGASTLHQWGRAKVWWQWASVVVFGIVGTWSAVAYLLGMTPPFLILQVAIAPGAIAVFLLLMLVMMFLPSNLTLRRGVGVGMLAIVLYLLCAPYITKLTGIDLWHITLPIWSAVLSICGLAVIFASEDTGPRNNLGYMWRIVWTIAVIGIVGTTIAVRVHSDSVQKRDIRRFTQEVTVLQNQVEAILDSYNTLARGLAQQTETFESLTQEQWMEILARLDARTYPAISAVSYVPRVTEDQKEMFPVTYATSFAEGLQVAPGFDISTDEVRNSTLRSAIAGRAVMATPVMSDTGMFSLYAPLNETVGIVAITIDKEKLVRQISSIQSQSVRISIAEARDPRVMGGLVHVTSMRVGQTPWTVVFSSTQQFNMPSRDSSLAFGYIATGVLALIFLVLYTLFHTRRYTKTKGTFVIQPIKTAVLPVLQALVDEYEGIFAQKKIHFEATIPKRLPLVVADTTVLWIALGSILRNAYQTTLARGTVNFEVKTVSIKRVPQSIVISCADTGCGYSTQTQHKLFQKASTYIDIEQAGGAVESLYTANRMLVATGATLEFASDEGVGTTVTVTLPSAVTEAPKVL